MRDAGLRYPLRRVAVASGSAPALPGGVAAKRPQEVDLAERRPVGVAEVQLGVHGLPEQEVGHALLTAGADDEVGVGLPAGRNPGTSGPPGCVSLACHLPVNSNPRVELQDGPVRKDYQAREVHDTERAAWRGRAVATWPDYAEYQKNTTRTIPVSVLTPGDA